MIQHRMTRLAALIGLLPLLPHLAVAAGPMDSSPAATPLGAGLGGNQVRPASAVESLSLQGFIELIARSDEQVLIQKLEEDIADEGVKGAGAIFEPSFFAEAEHSSSYVLNTASEQLQRAGQAYYKNKDNIYKFGVDKKLVYGTDVELFYNPSRLTNSLQANAGVLKPEYRTSMGVKITQPLLRNAGEEATTSNIKVAERDKLIAKETLRQILSQRAIDGLVAYFNVQRAKERVRLRTQSVDWASRLVAELKRQEKAGLKSSTEVLDAEANLALRSAQLAQGQQDLEEQLNNFQVFVSARARESGSTLGPRRYEPSDPLVLLARPPAAEAAKGNAGPPDQLVQDGDVKIPLELQEKFARRPEIRVNDLRMERENLRVRYAQNQMLPELNLTVRYGIDDLRQGNFQNLPAYFTNGTSYPYNSWMVNLQFRYYLEGDEKHKSEHATAMLKGKQVLVARTALQQRIAYELESSHKVLERSMQQVRRQQDIVTSQKTLLDIDTGLMKQGRKSSIDLMKRQLELLTAEESLGDAMVIANRASFITSQADGTLLKRLALE